MDEPDKQQPFELSGGGLVLKYHFRAGGNLRLRSLLPADYAGKRKIPYLSREGGHEVALHCTGEDRDSHHGAKLTGGNPGARLILLEKREEAGPGGKTVTLVQADPVTHLQVESVYEFRETLPVVRRFTRLLNAGSEPIGIEYVSSAIVPNFAYLAEGRLEDNLRISAAYNSWQAEAQWQTWTPSALGWVENSDDSNSGASFSSLSVVPFTNVSSWSGSRWLPLGLIENQAAGLTWFWQIEHNGSWHAEIADTPSVPINGTYLYLGGPDEAHSHAWKELLPGERFETVPVAIGCVAGGRDEAVAALTGYRRAACLRPHNDNRRCPVIFNDYMNCLMGDPTAEKELPLIDAAAEAGCDYFVIDAGWYAEKDEIWWDSVGLWQPSKTRFPEGLPKVLDYIRGKGMVPGLWLEIEVIGMNSPLKDQPDDWFFRLHCKRVCDHGRYILDFRQPEVRAHAHEVVRRVVSEYGAGYLKMDYNVSAAVGTDTAACSPGQGLLEHNRAFLRWLDEVAAQYPDLVIENCASGGYRADYAMLARAQLHSSSDQLDYRKNPSIVVGCAAAVLPEQLAVWSYPKEDASPDAASFNMVNAMLGRIHQSGHLDKLRPECLAQVKRGIALYKEKIAPFVGGSVPFFPLGMPSMADTLSPVALGMKYADKSRISVWRLAGGKAVVIPCRTQTARVLYPEDLGIFVETDGIDLTVVFPRKYMAAIVEVD